ncbi:MAG TPA: bile acid:sodium symporter [Candidatus Eisenbacteria bacterium]|nr:bile acid:sodium symporter [Candidatus Eisenbacteria bacterium]
MFLLSASERLLVVLFLWCSVMGVGMQSSMAEMRSLLASRGYLFRALLANFVLVPLVGIALVRIIPFSPAGSGALLLLACVPGGLSMVKYTSKVKGESSQAGATLALLSLLAVFVSPFLLGLALPANVEFAVPYDRILAFIAVLVLLPLGLGLLVRRKSPDLAERLAKILGLVGTVAFVIFMSVTKVFRKEALQSVSIPAVVGMIVLLVAAMAIGWFLGGPARKSRQILATSTSMRNAALCLAIANSSPSGQVLIAPLLGFTILMIPPNLLFTLYHSIRSKREARRAGGAPLPRGGPPHGT